MIGSALIRRIRIVSVDVTVYGIDFTSVPEPGGKVITCLQCALTDGELVIERMHHLESLAQFTQFLAEPPGDIPWIAGIDFPFGQSRQFVENNRWSLAWTEYLHQALFLRSRDEWVRLLNRYKADRPYGDKHHRRRTDNLARGQSPQTIKGSGVALMFYEGAPLLRRANVWIPGVKAGPHDRVVVEAYPRIVVRNIANDVAYKPNRETEPRRRANRQRILQLLSDEEGLGPYNVVVSNPSNLDLVTDPNGDDLDALLCAVQAAWAWENVVFQLERWDGIDRTEGWIADPKAITHWPPLPE